MSFKYIDKIGLELEGGWDKLRTDLIKEVSLYQQDFAKYVCFGERITSKDELCDSLEKVNEFSKQLKFISISSNLGDSRTIMTHPGSTTHSKLSMEDRAEVGISDGLVRISVGLEHIDDLIEDITQALNHL
jgi:O-acetylhomoserine/O-acetylserine sulfhydrylase-like pyridoxal-dependent enzyme